MQDLGTAGMLNLKKENTCYDNGLIFDTFAFGCDERSLDDSKKFPVHYQNQLAELDDGQENVE